VLGSVIVVASGVSLIYMTSGLFELPLGLIIGFGLLSVVAIVWMAIRILKVQWLTDKTFDEYFYQDREDIRRNENHSSEKVTVVPVVKRSVRKSNNSAAFKSTKERTFQKAS